MQKLENWTATYTQLSRTDQENDLKPNELETYALAAYLTGKDLESFAVLDRAHQGYLNLGKTKQAVRCAFWLGLMLLNVGKKARGSGWIARGERLLNSEIASNCAEKGLLLIPAALGSLYEGQPAKALKLFEQAATIGEQFKDPDLIALARLGCGQAMIHQGSVAKGIKLLDETMVFVETEDLFPIASGLIYCAVIETCHKVWDLNRAQEWTSALTRWCDAQPDIVPFRGQCLVRRAELIQLHGEWNRALEEAKEACVLLTRPPGEPAAGEAFYRKAELLRLLGDFEQAEKCYREAVKWNRIPQPGLALLRLAQNQGDAAETAIKNSLRETRDTKKRSEMLPGVVHILLAMSQIEEADRATKELWAIASEFDAPYLDAISTHCQGAVFFAKRNYKIALVYFHKALKLWNSMQLPYESAQTRELKGRVYLELNDNDNAELDLAAAKWSYEQLNARPDLHRINQLRHKKKQYNTYGLTLREMQVLSRVASGKTNNSIGGELFISERTVDRHVSNIYKKLNVSSRVEATTFAIRNNLLYIDP